MNQFDANSKPNSFFRNWLRFAAIWIPCSVIPMVLMNSQMANRNHQMAALQSQQVHRDPLLFPQPPPQLLPQHNPLILPNPASPTLLEPDAETLRMATEALRTNARAQKIQMKVPDEIVTEIANATGAPTEVVVESGDSSFAIPVRAGVRLSTSKEALSLFVRIPDSGLFVCVSHSPQGWEVVALKQFKVLSRQIDLDAEVAKALIAELTKP